MQRIRIHTRWGIKSFRPNFSLALEASLLSPPLFVSFLLNNRKRTEERRLGSASPSLESPPEISPPDKRGALKILTRSTILDSVVQSVFSRSNSPYHSDRSKVIKVQLKQLPSKAAKMRPDWANLPAELLILISEKASTTNVQYVHLRTVCKAWWRALTPNPRHLPRQTPWLFLPLDAHRQIGVDDFHLSFYDLSQSRTHRFELPYVSGKHIYGSHYGWLVLEHDKRVSLHNPVTRSSIELPSLDAPPTILSAAVSKKESSIPSVSTHYVGKVVFSCNPSERGCVVVAWLLYQSKWELAFCRIGDTHWTGVKMMDTGRRLLDFTCDNKSLYMVNTKREVLAYDLESLAMRTFPSKINYNGMHDRINLVEGDAEADGPLVVITTEYLGKLKQIYVYKWINYEQRWRRVKNIGKSVLFLSRYDCCKLQLEEQRGNEIYYDIRHDVDMGSHRICINKINMQSGSIVPHCPSPTEVFPTVSGSPSWFTPSLI